MRDREDNVLASPDAGWRLVWQGHAQDAKAEAAIRGFAGVLLIGAGLYLLGTF